MKAKLYSYQREKDTFFVKILDEQEVINMFKYVRDVILSQKFCRELIGGMDNDIPTQSIVSIEVIDFITDG
ncbi:MAG: hypothetical protein N2Z58_07305 [Fervidobacterium sp.]|nr:hypothetical protein [Fervidobacterium sp.]